MQNLFSCSVKLIKYSASAVNVGLSNACDGPLPRIKKSIFYCHHSQINSYLQQLLLRFYQTHWH